MSSWNWGLKPVPQVARPFETQGEKIARKCRENPYVPVGAFLTVGNLVMAVVSLAKGRSRTMNLWLRGRVAMQGLTIVALLVGASRMGELDWGPDRFQRVVHWDLRQLLLQEQTAFWARKSAAQLMDEIETNVFGKGVMAKRDGELADVETSGGPKKSRGWLGGRGKSKPPPKVDDENAL